MSSNAVLAWVCWIGGLVILDYNPRSPVVWMWFVIAIAAGFLFSRGDREEEVTHDRRRPPRADEANPREHPRPPSA